MFKSVNLNYQPREILLKNVNFPDGEPEMSEFESAFLCGCIEKIRPKKIVEVGIAGGGTTAIMMQCMSLLGLDGQYEIHSVDIEKRFYKGNGEKSGYLADEVKRIIGEVNHYEHLGKILPECIEEIGKDIDFILLDTVHALPGELFDFLTVIPYLKNGAMVVLHDISNNFVTSKKGQRRSEYSDKAYSNKIILDAVYAEKYIMKDPSHEMISEFPNIGSFIYTEKLLNNLVSVVSPLTYTWLYIPDARQWNAYEKAIIDVIGNDGEALWLWNSAVEINKSIHSTLKVGQRITVKDKLYQKAISSEGLLNKIYLIYKKKKYD